VGVGSIESRFLGSEGLCGSSHAAFLGSTTVSTAWAALWARSRSYTTGGFISQLEWRRADRLFKRLRIARLYNSLDVELRKLLRVDLLIIDDFALSALDTADFYETVVERHQRESTILTSNRDPSEWLGLMTDPLLAQSAVDRLKSAAYELVIDGESFRDRQKPVAATAIATPRAPMRQQLSHRLSRRKERVEQGRRHRLRPQRFSKANSPQSQWTATVLRLWHRRPIPNASHRDTLIPRR